MTQNNEREAFEKCRIDEGYVLSDGSMSNENYELTEKWFLLGRQSISQNEQQEAVAYADASLVCTISTYMIKELESRNENNKFPYHLWPTKLYTSPLKQMPDWIDVSYEERRVLYKSLAKGNVDNFANLLSARLRELNTAPTNTEVGE